MLLITDRRQADVLLGNEKGRYTHADLNRVEQATLTLAGFAKVLDGDMGLVCKTDWALPGSFSPAGWPVKTQMERYLSNVRALRDRYAPTQALPESMEKLDWQGANQIESALLKAYGVLTGRLHDFQFSGEFFAGEENGI